MKWINAIILGLIDTYSTTNIYELCDCLNIQIIKLDKNNMLLRGNEAFYYRDYFGNEIIFIRNDLPLEYEKFVLAHELGHALIHTNISNAAFDKNLINTGKLERQANYFAFKLSNIQFDKIALEGMTLEQIAAYINIPREILQDYNLLDTV
jgi:Zn-dependent peptidase ImmA (M78 family)